MNYWKTKANDLDVGKLKTVPVDLKKLSADYEVVENGKFNTLKKKVNNLDKRILDATSLIHVSQYNMIHVSQYNRDKQKLEKKSGDGDKTNTRYKWFSDYNCFEYEN